MEGLSHIRYYGVTFRNDITVGWLSVGIKFGTFSDPGVKIQVDGLVYPLCVAQTTWFEMPMKHGIKNHEECDSLVYEYRRALS